MTASGFAPDPYEEAPCDGCTAREEQIAALKTIADEAMSAAEEAQAIATVAIAQRDFVTQIIYAAERKLDQCLACGSPLNGGGTHSHKPGCARAAMIEWKTR